MTVRANKPAFNVREKLKELTHSIGLKGRELMRAGTAQEARDLVSAGRKNLIINGDMRIAQRGTSFTTAASGTFAADRWQYESSTNAVVTVSQVNAWNSGPYWAQNIKVETTTARSSTAADNFAQFLYHIEANDFGRFRFGTSEAKPFTFSFWVKSNKTGKFPASFQNHNGTRVFPTDYTITQADTWEKKVIVVPADTSGNWNLYGNSTGMRFTLMWSMGSNFTAGTNGSWAQAVAYANLTTCPGNQMDEVGATLEFAQVQLEEGKNATDFEHRSYGEELALCQRYCYQITGGSATFPICNGSIWDATTFIGVANLPVPLRDPGNIDVQFSAASHVVILSGGSTQDVTNIGQVSHHFGNQVEFHASVTMTVGNGAWARLKSGTTYIRFVSEL